VGMSSWFKWRTREATALRAGVAAAYLFVPPSLSRCNFAAITGKCPGWPPVCMACVGCHGWDRGRALTWAAGADKSDFFNDAGEAAALWRAVFDDERAGEEDLEEHEVLAGVREYQGQRGGKGRRDSSKSRAGRGAGHRAPRKSGGSPKKAVVMEDGWFVSGSKHLGKIIRRHAEGIPESVMRGDGGKPKHDGWIIGDVIAWLPADRSNFFKDPMTKQEPAALWRVQYREIIAGLPQQEELEEEEIVDAHTAYEAWKSALLDTDEWLVAGSDYLKKRVRKAVASLDGGKHVVNATISGWLPPEQSNFFPDPATQVPVALWRILFDDETIGAEDLEEAEVIEYMEAYDVWKSAEDAKKRSHQSKGARGSSSPSKRRCGGLERNARQRSAHTSSGEGGDGGGQGTNAAPKDPRGTEKKGKRVQELRGRKKTPDGRVMYLAHWSGTTSDDDSWVEAAQLGKDEWLVSEWEQEHTQQDAAEAGSGKAAGDGVEAGEEGEGVGDIAQHVGNTLGSGADEDKKAAQDRKRPRESQEDGFEHAGKLSGPETTFEEGDKAGPSLAAARALEQVDAGDEQGCSAGGGAGGRHEAGSARSPEPAVAEDGQGARSKRVRRPARVFGEGGSESE